MIEYSTETPVHDLPIWENCPWRPLVSKRFSFHLGNIIGQGEVGVVWDEENQLHISATPDSFTEANLVPAMLNLCGCAWEKKFGVGAGNPGLYMELIAKKNGLLSKLSDDEFAVLFAQYDKMHLWQAEGLPGSQSLN